MSEYGIFMTHVASDDLRGIAARVSFFLSYSLHLLEISTPEQLAIIKFLQSLKKGHFSVVSGRFAVPSYPNNHTFQCSVILTTFLIQLPS